MIYSMDLSAAFDLIRPGIFARKSKMILEDSMTCLILDFITNRRAFVEVGAGTSTMFKFEAGCPQGSTLGPKVFNLYCHDLVNVLDGHGHIVTYADDSYVIVEANTLEELKVKTVNTMNLHLHWLSQNGMVCNVDKTELMLMNSEHQIELEVDSMKITTQSTMKVLGIMFDDKLKWSEHVDGVVKKTNRILHGLRQIRGILNKEQSKCVVTSFYFSVLFYGCEIWLHRHLSFHLKKKLRSAHYRALRLVYGKEKSRDDLDKMSGRANPDEWSYYVLGKLLAKMVNSAQPVRLLTRTLMNSYYERRQENRMFFYDDSSRMIGRQILCNRLQMIARRMNFGWIGMKDDPLRINLKKSFFSYYREVHQLPKRH